MIGLYEKKMSVGVCGYITLSGDSIADKVDFSFCLMEQSVKCGLGCKLGGNVSCNAYSICEKDITKSPICPPLYRRSLFK